MNQSEYCLNMFMLPLKICIQDIRRIDCQSEVFFSLTSLNKTCNKCSLPILPLLCADVINLHNYFPAKVMQKITLSLEVLNFNPKILVSINQALYYICTKRVNDKLNAFCTHTFNRWKTLSTRISQNLIILPG